MEDKILLTARYVEGDMDEVERINFEQRMQEEQDLQEHLKDYTDIHQSLKMYLRNDPADQLFKDTLTHFGSQYFAEEAKVMSLKPVLKWLSGVAAVLLVGLLIWAPWRSNLYDEFAGNSEMMVTERGAAQTTDLDRAAALYNNKEYSAAEKLLEKQYILHPKDAMLAYYYGKTLTENNQLNKAQSILTAVYEGQSAFKYDAAYALALSHLKVNNKLEAKRWLLKIPAGTAHEKQAKALLGRL